VLCQSENSAILTSLPTSKDYIPNSVSQKCGCIEMPEINLNCFIITPETCVTECGKHFPLQTYLYGQNIQCYDIAFLNQSYPLENIDFEIWGKMQKKLFDNLITCFRNSKSIKRKYKAILAL
jgi:hypothetical protein